MHKRIVLISCVSQKLPHKAPAKNLYTSTLFRLNLEYAERLNPHGIYILSAKYGLLGLAEEVCPYEKTLNTMRAGEIKQWAARVLEQIHEAARAHDAGVRDIEFVFFAGEKYRKYLLPHLAHVQIPLEGLPIGKQLQRLKQLIHELRPSD